LQIEQLSALKGKYGPIVHPADIEKNGGIK
jgi:hypothetical protein